MTAVQPPVTPSIDPAEALIVTTGLEPFLRHTSRDLRGAIVRAETLPDTLETRLYRFMGREEPEDAPEPPAVDYDEVVKLLDNPPADGQIGKTMAAFGDHHSLALDVGTQVTRMVTYLRQQIPRRKQVGIAGPEDFPPPKSEQLRFLLCWRTAVDPMSLFDDMDAWSMSRGQRDCFGQLFPTTTAHLWPTIERMMARKRTQVDGWQPGRRQEVQLRILGKQEDALQPLAQALQPVFQAEQQAQAAQQQAAQPGPKEASQADEATAVERLDAAS